MNGPNRIDREAAEELFLRFAPMFADFEKRDTIAIYGADPQASPRPQDYVDVGILKGLDAEDGAGEAAGSDNMPSSDLLTRLSGILGGQ